jgi:hypothetical protein
LAAVLFGKQPLGRSKRWENNIEIQLREVDNENVNQIHVTQGYVQWQALALAMLLLL